MALQVPQKDPRPIEEGSTPDDGRHDDAEGAKPKEFVPNLGEVDLDDPYGLKNPDAPQDREAIAQRRIAEARQKRDAIAQRNLAHALASFKKDSMAACKIILERYPQPPAPQPPAPQPSAAPAELQHQ